MTDKVIRFLKNDLVFWIFFIFLAITMVLFVLKKEGIKITITFSEPYNNKKVEIFGD